MKTLLIIVILVIAGCSPIRNSSHYVTQSVETALRQDPGWNVSGYVIKDDQKEIKIGAVSSEMLYDLSENDPRDVRSEESLKEEGFILGIHFRKNF